MPLKSILLFISVIGFMYCSLITDLRWHCVQCVTYVVYTYYTLILIKHDGWFVSVFRFETLAWSHLSCSSWWRTAPREGRLSS